MRPSASNPLQRGGGPKLKGRATEKDKVRLLIEKSCPNWNSLQAMARAAMTGGFVVWDFDNDCPQINPETGRIMHLPIGEKTRSALLKDVNEYQYPKRRAMEFQDPDGNAMNPGLMVGFVAPGGEDKE